MVSDNLSECDPLTIESLTIKADRVIATAVVSQQVPSHTNESLMDVVLQRFPSLGNHTCKNEEGATFAAVMHHTSIPHLLEHLVIDLQTRNCEDPRRTFVGTTEWINRKQGRARIEVSFTDDLVALQAFRDASRFLNNAMIQWVN